MGKDQTPTLNWITPVSENTGVTVDGDRDGTGRRLPRPHINSDSSASGMAADPDNIKLVASEEHLREHDGNFRNPTSYGTPVEEEE